MIAKLALENGTVFSGVNFGAEGEVSGEVCFNTSLTGYQEIVTDPSYAGQLITMTSPMIGNYGVNEDDTEAQRPHARGFIVREYFDTYSNFRATESLSAFLKKHGIVAVQGIDTRMLTKMLRTEGSLRGVLSTTDLDDDCLVAKARALPSMSGQDLASTVTCCEPYAWSKIDATQFALAPDAPERVKQGKRYNVVVLDYGVKHNILRRLTAYGCALTVVPASTSAEEILKMNPDGIFLSNGPGDPEAVTYAIENLRRLIGRKPIFGICLGHQLLALALGGKTYKLKFGHRGGNHPVKNLRTGDIEVTSQNHGFAVDWSTMDESKLTLTHLNLNDSTVEGFQHKDLPLFCVQYHPEASPGPHDSDYLFKQFIDMMDAQAA
ncbi:MAG TPA: glutamine-hydrolyzing carbamoyl-phosphate synthase small subunit [Bacteroidota bacterium]|nr:glutamine-hydrolyzing carbamoyl-phosphate synthase small subunit [Bacteroidota bacterium]